MQLAKALTKIIVEDFLTEGRIIADPSKVKILHVTELEHNENIEGVDERYQALDYGQVYELMYKWTSFFKDKVEIWFRIIGHLDSPETQEWLDEYYRI
ncbi:uncharacterized protein LOC123015885 [Tribolium madens]|uniref:uncharacterized protein LOC123015885 n=1 Tax=Tribolium madens TaxID=41895 RepID=UPI001CF71D91|nr:uncharacterized protein LOC123015885 [Tribolium madens]